MKYATTNEDGVPTAFYDPAVNKGQIPDGAIELTDDQWRECIENQGRRAVDTSGDTPQVVEYTPPNPPIETVEAQCLTRIDRTASRVRERFITSGSGQEGTYLSKLEEARAYKNASDPDPTDYPLLEAESDRRNMDMADLADEVIEQRKKWIEAAKTIEAERVGGKEDVRAADDADAKREACDTAVAKLKEVEP